MRTTVDGLGRTVRVTVGTASQVYSIVDTEYAPCACSPLGKVRRVSQPYGPGGEVRWTTYTYDAMGRTTRVDLPDGSYTTYAYVGNTTTITDPAGKWKKYTVDGVGNLVQVTEPAPEGGYHETYYVYNVLGQLTTVNMPRGAHTQTRTFNYDLPTGRLMSAINPENGTVSYTYNADGTIATKTDAKNQRTEITYDEHQRVSEVRYYAGGVEQTCQRVNYTYAANGTLSQATWGGSTCNPGDLRRRVRVRDRGTADLEQDHPAQTGRWRSQYIRDVRVEQRRATEHRGIRAEGIRKF